MKKIILLMTLGVLILTGCATGNNASRFPAQAKEDESGKHDKTVPVPEITPGEFALNDLTFFKTPGDNDPTGSKTQFGHGTFIEAIKNANDTIIMEMFHLTDPDVIAEFKELKFNVKVKLILDQENLKKCTKDCVADILKDKENILIYPSSKKFSITHSKSMIVDGKTAYITSINLTDAANKTRDYGVITHDPHVIQQLQDVYDTDVTNSQIPNNDLPTSTTENHLIFAPIPMAQGKLVALILSSIPSTETAQRELSTRTPSATTTRKRSAKTISEATPDGGPFLYATVESLNDDQLGAAFVKAAKAGVDVRIIVPMCVENSNKSYNYPWLTGYVKQAGMRRDGQPFLKAKMMPGTGTLQQPYIHGKMMVSSNNTAYVGSENFTNNSLTTARETGIIFENQKVASDLKTSFLVDWDVAEEPAMCPKADDDDTSTSSSTKSADPAGTRKKKIPTEKTGE